MLRSKNFEIAFVFAFLFHFVSEWISQFENFGRPMFNLPVISHVFLCFHNCLLDLDSKIQCHNYFSPDVNGLCALLALCQLYNGLAKATKQWSYSLCPRLRACYAFEFSRAVGTWGVGLRGTEGFFPNPYWHRHRIVMGVKRSE